MRERLILFFTLTAVVVTIVLFNTKIHREQDEMGKVEESLSGLQGVIPPWQSIAYQPIEVKQEVGLWAKYTLAPCYVAYMSILPKKDTILTICPVAYKERITQKIMATGNMIWSNADNQYFYILSCSKHG